MVTVGKVLYSVCESVALGTSLGNLFELLDFIAFGLGVIVGQILVYNILFVLVVQQIETIEVFPNLSANLLALFFISRVLQLSPPIPESVETSWIRVIVLQ